MEVHHCSVLVGKYSSGSINVSKYNAWDKLQYAQSLELFRRNMAVWLICLVPSLSLPSELANEALVAGHETRLINSLRSC